MGSVEARCARLAARQHGVIAREQALRVGLSKRAIGWRLSAGEWERLLPSVYRIAAAAPCWLQRLKAATLWAAPESAASHRAAAALWELDGFGEGTIELTTSRLLSSNPSWITLHRSRRLEPDELVGRSGILVTRPARTLLDLGTVASSLQVEAALESAVRRGRVTLEQLESCLALRGRHGQRGTAILRAILAARAPEAAPTESVLESRLLRVLRRGRLPEPARQLEVGLGNGAVARLDFAYPDHRLAIETDGAAYHFQRERWERDHQRRSALAALGWRSLVITWARLEREPGTVAAEIRQALQSPFIERAAAIAVPGRSKKHRAP